ncbi:MAG: hypothetical protein P8Q54_04340 [Akkermansiaceae bacterium]|nr:hypothetical protein [Akkermansiaceae bacterium]
MAHFVHDGTAIGQPEPLAIHNRLVPRGMPTVEKRDDMVVGFIKPLVLGLVLGGIGEFGGGVGSAIVR